MQQAIVAERRGSDSTTAASGNAFVINLVSSTTPVALTRPDHAGLNRFTFFVSRRREDGRERFRLHMGYFDSQEEAEKLLDIVRGIYPGAWAGLAPGRRLAAASTTAAPPAAAAAVPPAVVPPIAVAAAPTPAVAAVSAKVRQPAPAPIPAPVAAATPPAVAPSAQEQQTAARALSNIREAIAALSDSATIPVLHAATALQSKPAAAPPALVPPAAVPTVMAPTVILRGPMTAPAKVPPVKVLPTKAPQTKAPPSPALPARMPAATAPAVAAELSDSATLRLLEGGAQGSTAAVSTAKVQPFPSPPSPREERPCYAVQLMWSVQPIAMAQVPQLAIFSAYTLYGAEGNRDGRRWYGLRLGFFTDAVSAKQVAHYVRADFSTVSVVPVTVREREQAKLASARASGAAVKPAADATKSSGAAGRTATADGTKTRTSEFALIDDKESLTIKTAKPGGVVQLRPGVPVRATRGAPGKRAKQRPQKQQGQVHARSRARPMTLEETLEILGAGALHMDNEPGLPIKDLDQQHQRLDTVKSRPSKLTRLFERLSDRLGN